MGQSLNPRNIDKSVSDIRIRFPFESSFWISVSGCKLTILPDIQPVNRIVVISAALQPAENSCFSRPSSPPALRLVLSQRECIRLGSSALTFRDFVPRLELLSPFRDFLVIFQFILQIIFSYIFRTPSLCCATTDLGIFWYCSGDFWSCICESPAWQKRTKRKRQPPNLNLT